MICNILVEDIKHTRQGQGSDSRTSFRAYDVIVLLPEIRASNCIPSSILEVIAFKLFLNVYPTCSVLYLIDTCYS